MQSPLFFIPKEMGIKVVMVTGDNQQTANAIGRLVGVDYIKAGVLPEGKIALIQKLRSVSFSIRSRDCVSRTGGWTGWW